MDQRLDLQQETSIFMSMLFRQTSWNPFQHKAATSNLAGLVVKPIILFYIFWHIDQTYLTPLTSEVAKVDHIIYNSTLLEREGKKKKRLVLRSSSVTGLLLLLKTQKQPGLTPYPIILFLTYFWIAHIKKWAQSYSSSSLEPT